MKAPRVLAVLLAALVVTSGGVVASSDLDPTPDSTLSTSAAPVPDSTLESYDEPRWVVQIESQDDYSTLENWANASDRRHLIGELDSTNRTVVAAPGPMVSGGLVWTDTDLGIASVPTPRWVSSGLAERSYVAAIEPDLAVTRPDPVNLRSAASYTRPDGALGAQISTGGKASFSSDGVAWSEDANESTLSEARAATNSDAVAADGTGYLAANVDTGCATANGRVFGNGTSGSDIRIHNASKSFVDPGEPSVNATAGNFSAVEDENGHGTHTASTMVANYSGTELDGYAPNATLLCLKALGEDGSGSSHGIARAIRYAADHDADVLSLSLGSQIYSQEIAEAVTYAIGEGTVVVVATGNSRPQTGVGVTSPADTPNSSVIAVGAANVSEDLNNTLPAFFSQGGPDAGTKDLSNGVTEGQSVTLVAPGMRLTAATPTASGTLKNTTLSGTSMATPNVAGAVIQLMGEDTSLQGNPQAVHDRLFRAAHPMPHAAENVVGGGYLDVEAAVANETTQSQADAMTDEARARNAGLDALSDSEGGFIWEAGRAWDGVTP